MDLRNVGEYLVAVLHRRSHGGVRDTISLAEFIVMTKGLVALVAVAAMTGCASPEKKAEKAEMGSVKADAAYCNDLAGLATESMEASYAKVHSATAAMDKAEAKALVAAHDAYTAAVAAIPGSTTLGAAATQVQGAYTEYQNRVQGLTGVECVAMGEAAAPAN